MTERKNLMLWIALLLAIGFGAAVERRPPDCDWQRIDRLPATGAIFSSRPLTLSPNEVAVFGQAHVVKRFYRCQGRGFVLVAIDGSANRHAVHDPLYCLKGAGWQVVGRQRIGIDGGEGELLRLSRNGHERETVYWISDGSSRHASILRYWLQATMRRLTFGHSGPEPVMMLLQSIGDGHNDWQAILDQCVFLFDI